MPDETTSHYGHDDVCPECKGEGQTPKSWPAVCPTCKGSGYAPVPAAPAPEATREADDVAMLLDEMDADVCMFDEIRGDPDKDTSDFFPNTLDLIRRLRAAIDAERAAQARENETLRADAERWRFVRPRLCIWRERTMAGERHPFLRVEIGRGRMPDDTPTCSGDANPDVLDAAIDAALAARAPEAQP